MVTTFCHLTLRVPLIMPHHVYKRTSLYVQTVLLFWSVYSRSFKVLFSLPLLLSLYICYKVVDMDGNPAFGCRR